MTIQGFAEKVDEVSKRKYGIAYTEENGIDDAISNAFYGGESAEEFVDWWGEKYDMTPIL